MIYTMSCPVCGDPIVVNFSNAENVDSDVFDKRPGMGEEYIHTSRITLQCSGCKTQLTSVLEQHEYPVGSPRETYNPPYFEE